MSDSTRMFSIVQIVSCCKVAQHMQPTGPMGRVGEEKKATSLFGELFYGSLAELGPSLFAYLHVYTSKVAPSNYMDCTEYIPNYFLERSYSS